MKLEDVSGFRKKGRKEREFDAPSGSRLLFRRRRPAAFLKHKDYGPGGKGFDLIISFRPFWQTDFLEGHWRHGGEGRIKQVYREGSMKRLFLSVTHSSLLTANDSLRKTVFMQLRESSIAKKLLP